jgi:L-ascorbate metabolism protein UlaG (beta-lactamase superfamily)
VTPNFLLIGRKILVSILKPPVGVDGGGDIKEMKAIVLLLLLSLWTPQLIGVAEPKTDIESRQEKVTLKWLGTAGWEIELGKTVILIDPFLTRKDRSLDAEWKTDEEAVLKVIRGADYIFAGHSHHDHIGDIPFIAKRFGSKVIGSRTTTNLALTAGVDKSQVITISGGENLVFNDFSVQVIESRHGWREGKAPRRENEEILRPWPGPIRGRDFVDGGSYIYYFAFGKHRVLHQSTGNVIKEKLRDVRPDVAIMNLSRQGYDFPSVLKMLNPKIIIVHHFDDWKAPFSEGISEQNLRRARGFAAAVGKVDSRIKVIIPQILMTYTLE